ncbi:unnamed protein product [Malus baccata var. baccata]
MWICEFLAVYSSSQSVCGSLLPVELISDDNQTETEIKIWGFNLSASNLLRAGIEFEKGEDNLLNITFSNGKLRIPPVGIINLLNRNRVGDQEYFVEFKTILNTVVVKNFCFGKFCNEVNAYIHGVSYHSLLLLLSLFLLSSM